MIYEFLCTNCGTKEDISLLIKDRNNEQFCKKCNTVLSRLIGHNTSFIFKGPGFWATDYRKEKRQGDCTS